MFLWLAISSITAESSLSLLYVFLLSHVGLPEAILLTFNFMNSAHFFYETLLLRKLHDLCLQVIKAYAFNKAWIFGLLMDLFGAVLMLRALSLAPVSAFPASFLLCMFRKSNLIV